MNRLQHGLATLAAAAALLSAGPAAATTYDWTLSVPEAGGGTFAGSGTFTTLAPISGPTLVQSWTGVIDGQTITGLLPVGTFAGNNNLVYDTGVLLDGNGVSFGTAAPTYVGSQVNIYYDPGFLGYTTSGATLYNPNGFSYTLAGSLPVPAPAGLLVFGVGLLGLGVARRAA